MAIVLSHLRCLIMYIFDQQIEIESQFESPKQMTFKTSESRKTDEQTFVLNQKQTQHTPNGFFLGSTFHKMNVHLNLNNMRMKPQFSKDFTNSNEFNQTKNSIITANDSQLQKSTIRTSYILEKYEISK
jgi:hypothetical protein